MIRGSRFAPERRIALIGAGIMGTNHARTIASQPDCELSVVVDTDPRRAKALASRYGGYATTDLADVVGQADCAVVASPTPSHAAIVTSLLGQGLPLLVEKPLAMTLAETRELVDAVDISGLPLLVGHIERFNGAYGELQQRRHGMIHLEMRRTGPYTGRVNTDVVADLMIHDIDIALSLLEGEITDIHALAHTMHEHGPDLVEVLLRSSCGVIAALTASRIGQRKSRTVVLTTPDCQVAADLLRQDVTVHRIQHGEFVNEGGVVYRQTGMVEIPFVQHGEPLATEHRHFADVVNHKATPLIDVHQALRCALVVAEIQRQVAG